ncbi:guanylate-binding protein 7-like isoform X1 [Montipora foliosa]|uniref:guanylate-binding protein 7-like isoform X1 n=1 Tax=Montipora foliosa TaxID=591990 RepID=UPI0035F197F6
MRRNKMAESHSLRRFQWEDEEEALARALKNSQEDDSARAVCHHSQEDRYDSRQPSQRNLGFHEDEDEEFARAIALSRESLFNRPKSAGIRASKKGACAIPLCLPNNYVWNPRTGKIIKKEAERSSLEVVDEAVEKLREVKGPVCVVSIAGPYRKGKSYILSEAFDQPDVFPLGHQMVAETMGIWLWIVPGKYKDCNGQEFTVVLLDSEGIDSTTSESFDDHQIFTLTVLLASVLIYNSQGVPTRNDVEKLDFIVKLSKRIQVRSTVSGPSQSRPAEDNEFFHKIFPQFVWLLRDVIQDIPEDCKDVKEYFLKKVFKDHPGQQVSESILRLFAGFEAFSLPPPTTDKETMKSLNQKKSEVNQLFLDGLKKFKSLMKRTLSPKGSFNDGEFVTGEGLAALVVLYVEAINTPDAIPNVQRAWDTFVSAKCFDVKQAALQTYDELMTSQLSDVLPCSNTEIRTSHDAALKECKSQFIMELAGISTNTIEMASRELKESVDKKLTSWLTDNEVKTRQFCKDLLDQLKILHLDPVFQRLQGRGAAEVSFDDIIGGYQRIKDEYNKSAKGAEDVIAKVFVELHAELLKEKEQYLGLLRQLKDFDEDRSRALVAKAYQEQERKRLEEQQSRLLQENRQQKQEMEMLIQNLEEERKRFREQMEIDRKAQRDQMKNMMAASMKHAKDERRAFVKENQALQHRLLELQNYNEDNMKMIKKLSDVTAKQKREKVELLQKMKDQADVDQETLIKKINDKHDEEMNALRDDMNAKLDEVKHSPPDETVKCGMPGLINKRTKEADCLQKKIDETHKEQQAVEEPGFCKRALKFVGQAVPIVLPAVAAIGAPVAAVAGKGIELVADHVCSVM